MCFSKYSGSNCASFLWEYNWSIIPCIVQLLYCLRVLWVRWPFDVIILNWFGFFSCIQLGPLSIHLLKGLLIIVPKCTKLNEINSLADIWKGSVNNNSFFQISKTKLIPLNKTALTNFNSNQPSTFLMRTCQSKIVRVCKGLKWTK